jgi:hypothetical protein
MDSQINKRRWHVTNNFEKQAFEKPHHRKGGKKTRGSERFVSFKLNDGTHIYDFGRINGLKIHLF